MADIRQQQSSVPHAEHGGPAGHGNSVAAWTCVGIIMLGSLLMAVAVIAKVTWVFVVGAVVVVLGAISGKVLAAMGFGVSGKPGH